MKKEVTKDRIDMSSRATMKIVEVEEKQKEEIAKKIFNNEYYEEIERKKKLLMEDFENQKRKYMKIINNPKKTCPKCQTVFEYKKDIICKIGFPFNIYYVLCPTCEKKIIVKQEF